MVKAMYMIKIPLAVSCVFGLSLLVLTLHASVEKSCLSFLLKDGNRAMEKMTIPKPPIHCKIDLQNRMPWGWLSRLLRMEAPVVVKPDMVSKKASVTESVVPYKRNGSIPKSEKNTQAPDMMM